MSVRALNAVVNYAQLVSGVQAALARCGIGLVRTDDPDYVAICDAYRTITAAYQRSDYATILTTIERDYRFEDARGNRLGRACFEAQLEDRLASQIESDYREEPAHVVLRGSQAWVATRIYGRTLSRRDGRQVAIREAAHHLTLWVKTSGGWKRSRTRVRYHVQNVQWALGTTTEQTPGRTIKYTV